MSCLAVECTELVNAESTLPRSPVPLPKSGILNPPVSQLPLWSEPGGWRTLLPWTQRRES